MSQLVPERSDEEWEKIADHMINEFLVVSILNIPEPTMILALQNENAYVGSLQNIAPDYSEQIVLLSKSSMPIPSNLTKALRKRNLPEYTIDSTLDISGRQHVLRRLGNRLTKMTSEQLLYVMTNLPPIYELSPELSR